MDEVRDCDNCFYCGVLGIDRPCGDCITDRNRPFWVKKNWMKLDCEDCSFRFSDRELLPCVGCANRKERD